MVYKYYGKYKEKLEDSKGVNRSRKWKDRQKKWPKEKGEKDKTLHKTLKIEQNEPH